MRTINHQPSTVFRSAAPDHFPREAFARARTAVYGPGYSRDLDKSRERTVLSVIRKFNIGDAKSVMPVGASASGVTHRPTIEQFRSALNGIFGAMAARIKPVSLTRGVLLLSCDHPVIHFEARAILNRQFPLSPPSGGRNPPTGGLAALGVKSIRWRIG
jgi:hypothetical protein